MGKGKEPESLQSIQLFFLWQATIPEPLLPHLEKGKKSTFPALLLGLVWDSGWKDLICKAFSYLLPTILCSHKHHYPFLPGRQHPPSNTQAHLVSQCPPPVWLFLSFCHSEHFFQNPFPPWSLSYHLQGGKIYIKSPVVCHDTIPCKTNPNKTKPILGFCLLACFFYFVIC